MPTITKEQLSPRNVLDVLNVYLVETMDEVLRVALAEPLPGRTLGPELAPVKVERAAGEGRVTH